MHVFKKLAFALTGTLLILALISCGSGGGGGGNPSVTSTVISGKVVDGFVAGATVTAYQVNPDGTIGLQIGTPVITDQFGNYTLDLGTFSGPVYLTSRGGTYTDTATGNPIDLTNSSLILSAIVPAASGNVTAQINPITTMAANVALTLVGQGTAVATAADAANTSIQNYFGLTSSILSTALLDLTKSGCMAGATQPNADISSILAGISELASTNTVSTPDLVQALIQDVTSDGLFDGLASGATISVLKTDGTGTIPLSNIEGTGLTGLATAISSFMTNTTTANICNAPLNQDVISALSNTDIFTVPAAPTGVQVRPADGAAIVSWNSVSRATSYNIYVANSTGVTPTSTQLPGYRSITDVTSPAAVSTGPSLTYYFVVTAVSGTSPYEGNEGPASAEAAAFVPASPVPTQWAQTMTAGSNQSSFNSVSAASDGSVVYAAGYITGAGAYDFGNSVTTAGTFTSGINAVLVQYDSTGKALWAQSVAAGADDSYFYSVSVAPDGSVYAAGYIATGTFNFGNNVTATGTVLGSNPILVKYDSTGKALWAQTLTAGVDGSAFFSVSVASDGSVYAAGYIYGTGIYNFGTGLAPVPVAGTGSNENVVLVKYNSSGAAQWAQSVTAGSGGSLFNGVSTASDGSVYAAGYIVGTGTPYNFGTIVTPVNVAGAFMNGINLVLVKYNGTTGAAQWAQTVAGSDYSNFLSVTVASDGTVCAAGDIFGTGTFDFGNSVTAGGTYAGFNPVVVKYDSTGAAQWAQTVTAGSNESEFNSVSVAPDGTVYAAGYITGTGTYSFGNGITATGANTGENVVLAIYGSSGVAQWAKTAIVGSGPSVFSGVSVAPGGTYVAGQIYGTGTYNYGNGATAAGPYSYVNIVLVKYSGLGSITLSW
jgi:hypothetical protein